MYEFWYDYTKPKYSENAKLYCIATDSFIVHVKTDDIYNVLKKMLKEDLILQITKLADCCLKKKIKK